MTKELHELLKFGIQIQRDELERTLRTHAPNETLLLLQATITGRLEVLRSLLSLEYEDFIRD